MSSVSTDSSHDVYELAGKNYFLRAGYNIHANQWATHHDPAIYQLLEEFVPQRWLESKYPAFKEPLTIYPNIQGFSAFGFGRRIYPGLKYCREELDPGCGEDCLGMCWKYPEYDYTRGLIYSRTHSRLI